ncbi:MAG TPA: energy transducer TonB, partial [Sphingomicrobium sp.]|nr:energy transducer TonB [Sphingomicrobium sp.]
VIIALIVVVSPASAEPLQPTGKWEVQYTASNCTAKRAYGDVLLTVEPSPLGSTTRYLIQASGKAGRARQYNSVVEPADGSPALKTTSLLFPLASKNRRALLTVLPLEQASRVENGGRLKITTRGTGIRQTEKVPNTPETMAVDLSLGSMAALRKAMDSCMDDLRGFWGMVDSKLPEPAQKADVNARGIFTADDYPADAMAANHTGRTRYLLLIDERGSLLDCAIDESSGIASLDAMGCQVMRERARIKPALDAAGKTMKSIYRMTVQWAIVDG